MTHLYKNCKLCPRNCGIDRLSGEIGFCGETPSLRVGAALIHRGEEPPLVEQGGSGTIFISGCNLGCAFCQNYQISQGDDFLPQKANLEVRQSLGKIVNSKKFAQICAALRDKGAQNINIVTGSHAVPAIIEGIKTAKEAGVGIPVLWNSSGYESAETLELLKDYVDIYLPDLKTLDKDVAVAFFNAPDYPQVATDAILKMMNSGKEVIIRHLILPGFLDSTRAVLKWFSQNTKGRARLSVMSQYTPIPNRARSMPDRYITKEEYDTVISWLEEFNIEDGFCQEFVTGSEWLPDFKRSNPFSSELSLPVELPA